MYFSKLYPPGIYQSSLSGRNVQVFVDSDIQYVAGLTIDFESSQLYWTDKEKQVITFLSRVLTVVASLTLIVSLRPSFLPGPGLGALLSSYLEGALYKFHR